MRCRSLINENITHELRKGRKVGSPVKGRTRKTWLGFVP